MDNECGGELLPISSLKIASGIPRYSPDVCSDHAGHAFQKAKVQVPAVSVFERQTIGHFRNCPACKDDGLNVGATVRFSTPLAVTRCGVRFELAQRKGLPPGTGMRQFLPATSLWYCGVPPKPRN